MSIAPSPSRAGSRASHQGLRPRPPRAGPARSPWGLALLLAGPAAALAWATPAAAGNSDPAAASGDRGAAAAAGHQDLAAIDRAVAEFTGAAPGRAGGAMAPVDRQLRLARCAQPLAIEPYRRDALRVACPTPGGWRIFVPLWRDRQAESAPGLREPVASAPLVIARRDLVRVEAGGRGFRISRQGQALEAGRVGEAIRIKLDDGTSTGRILSAQVVEAGLVRVGRQQP